MITQKQIDAADHARRAYLAECEDIRSKESVRLFGHPGASTTKGWVDTREMTRRMLEAAEEVRR